MRMVAADDDMMPEDANEHSLAIDLHDVRKIYPGRVEALRGVRMRARRGEIFGLLGPNGAGKSTLVKIMLTVVRPTAASGSILGRPIGTKSVLSRVGYLPEKHRFPDYLTGRQAIEFAGAMSNVDRRTRRRRATELLELVGMSDWGDRRVSTYSKGMLQRVGIAAAMVNEPDLVVLDEPTDGVDPVGRRDIRDVLLRIRNRGACVFLNSHLLSELEMVCDRMAIMVQGEVAAEGTIDDLTRESRRYEIRIAGSPPGWISDPAASGIGCRISVEEGADRGTARILIGSDDPTVVQPLIDRLRAENISIVSLQPIRESLEDLFLRFVKDPATGKARLPGAAGMSGRSKRTEIEG